MGTAETVEKYVAGTLLDRLGFSGRPFVLTETGLGIHNHVFYLDIDGSPPLVVKGIEKRQRLRTIVRCSEHLAEKGISVPGILYAEEDRRLFGRLGLNIICEERILGSTLQEKPPDEETIGRVARFFSGMHNVRRPAWGRVEQQMSRGLYPYLLGKVREKIRQWEALDAELDPGTGPELLGWMRTWRERIESLACFSLVHGDPNPGNVIAGTDGRLYVLDTGHVRYLPRAIDYYSLKVHLCRDSRSLAAVFDTAYSDGMPRDELAGMQGTLPFCEAYVLVHFAATLALRLGRCGAEDPFHDEFSTNLERIRRMLSGMVRGK